MSERLRRPTSPALPSIDGDENTAKDPEQASGQVYQAPEPIPGAGKERIRNLRDELNREHAERLAAVADRPKIATVSKPTIGRIVHYHEGLVEPAEICAAIVIGITPRGLSLAVFSKRGNTYPRYGVKEGTEHNQWSWPPRV